MIHLIDGWFGLWLMLLSFSFFFQIPMGKTVGKKVSRWLQHVIDTHVYYSIYKYVLLHVPVAQW